jgi:hypothetical protein
MHRQKEAFRSIFEEAKDWTDGVFKLLDWLKDSNFKFKFWQEDQLGRR